MPSHRFETITEQQLDQLTLAKRSNCLLDTSKLKQAGFVMTPTYQALSQCIKDYVARQQEPIDE